MLECVVDVNADRDDHVMRSSQSASATSVQAWRNSASSGAALSLVGTAPLSSTAHVIVAKCTCACLAIWRLLSGRFSSFVRESLVAGNALPPTTETIS